mmetsp:Transcript_28091/g.43402  ORF Transcript_28091/g.43402 Transcript_28091/m.43402 type:complete len:205 (+) Transcript_28091:554-1168(+)
MGVSSTFPQTSPRAYTPSALVLDSTSTRTCPRSPASSTPAATRPSPSVLGTRPMAARTTSSPPTTPPFASIRVFFPSSSFVTPATPPPVFRCMIIPLFTIAVSSAAEIAGSKFRRAIAPRVTRCTSDPSVRSIPASSTAMYPAPITATAFGRDSRSKNPSEEMQCSSTPGTAGPMSGRPPVAMRIFFPVTLSIDPSDPKTDSVL